MSRIHFASLVGVDYDLDLAPFWTKYYLDMKLDTYAVYLHREHGTVGEETSAWFEERGFIVHKVGGHHGNGMLRRICLESHARSLPENDFLVTADADEFQCVPRTTSEKIVEIDGVSYTFGRDPCPPDYRAIFEKYDIVTGRMIDRYGFALSPCERDPFDQYIFEEPLDGNPMLKSWTPPKYRKSKWCDTRRTKILASRCGHKTAYEGSHLMIEVPGKANIATDFEVIHFAWREASKRKVAVKGYYTRENISEIYDGNPPEELVDALNRMDSFKLLCGEENLCVTGKN